MHYSKHMAHIALICGSLRKKSFNHALALVAMQSVPAGHTIELIEWADVPVYNGDIEDAGMPESVARIRQKLEAANGILFVTPEYNRSIPGGLKNLIDWLSRPPKNMFDGKPIALMGASDGNFGTIQCQTHLRAILPQIGGWVMPSPNVYVIRAQDKFNTELQLTDQFTKDSVTKLLTAFTNWINK